MITKGCVLVHGFTGSPKEIEHLSNYLQANNIEISTPILAGHGFGLNKREMKNYTRQDWINSAESALKEMINKYDEVYLIGFSMGGLIASYLATKYPVKKLVLLSASVYYLNMKRFANELTQRLKTKTLSRYIYKIKQTPLHSVIQFRRLVKELVPYIQLVEVPTLIIQGELDDIVDPKSAQYIYDTIKANEKQIHLLPNSKHIVCMDNEKEKVVELVNDFII